MSLEENIICRILNVLPLHSIELNTFFRIFRVRLTTEIPTACITCSTEPALLLNPIFIAENCHTDEHLFMLIMHELYHIILGHTRLFPHPTPTLNIIFDAVINAMLCNMFPQEAYTSFFTTLYPSDQMPHALLRPIGQDTPASALPALRLLYTQNQAVTYYDIYRALSKTVIPDSEVLLLGSHDTADADNSLLNQVINEITREWPSPISTAQGIHAGDKLTEKQVSHTMPELSLRQGIARLIRLSQVKLPLYNRSKHLSNTTISASTFAPNARDRRHYSREILQGHSLLFESHLAAKRLNRNDTYSAFLYLDVSGSMNTVIPHVLSAIKPYIMHRQCLAFSFSTEVAPLSPKQARHNAFSTTGGTDINCVIRHLMSIPKSQCPSSIILITDGDTPAPTPQHITWLQQRHIQVFCGLVSSKTTSSSERELKPIVRRFIHITL